MTYKDEKKQLLTTVKSYVENMEKRVTILTSQLACHRNDPKALPPVLPGGKYPLINSHMKIPFDQEYCTQDRANLSRTTVFYNYGMYVAVVEVLYCPTCHTFYANPTMHAAIRANAQAKPKVLAKAVPAELCRVRGCSDTVFRNGYCQYHYSYEMYHSK